MTDCVGHLISRTRVSADEHGSSIVKVFRDLQAELRYIVPDRPALDDHRLDVSCAFPSNDVPLLP